MPIHPIAGLGAILAGSLIAWGFLAHLRWTLHRLPGSRAPMHLWMAHWILRLTAITLIFLAIAQEGVWLVVISVIAFTLTKFFLTRQMNRLMEPTFKSRQG